MINSYSISYEDLRQRILTAENIDREQKEYLLGILDGKLIAPMTSDAMSKSSSPRISILTGLISLCST